MKYRDMLKNTGHVLSGIAVALLIFWIGFYMGQESRTADMVLKIIQGGR